MKFREQTAVEGLFSAASFNLGARVITFVRHVVITAYIGLSAGLDAFYVAMSVMGIFILVFADIFDSLGIPFLVKALEEKGEEGFSRAAASIFRISVYLSVSLCALMLLSSPWSPGIAAGFAPDKRSLVIGHLFLLAPMAACYLPYHAIGSFFRARRRFQAFFAAEFIVSIVGLVVVLMWPRDHRIVSIAWSSSYLLGFLLLFTVYRRHFGSFASREQGLRKDFLQQMFTLIPVYGVGYIYTATQQYFASFLPEGSVAALSYGLTLCLLLPGILNIENVFSTPLAESRAQGEILEWILKGIILFSVPVTLFTCSDALPIVQAIFERGAFDDNASRMTATALACYAAALPGIMTTAVCVRVFLIRRRLYRLSILCLLGALLNLMLNFLLTRKAGLGLAGVALSTSITNYLLAAALLWRIHRETPIEGEKYFTGILAPSVAAALLALGLSVLLPSFGNRILDIVLRGLLFVGAYVGAIKVMPVSELRRMEEIFLRSFFRRGEASA